jgi:Acetoacetate decarboxylase (ADC)
VTMRGGLGRLRRQTGRYALVDGIPFELPVRSQGTPALMAAFTVDADRAQALLPGNELHLLRLGGRAILVVTVVDYLITSIGRYIEFSIALACTHGARSAPPLLPLLLRGQYGTGQYVLDLPVSTEISVKGGKGIWGMPKHRSNLDFAVGDRVVSSQYDLDGQLGMRIEIDRPRAAWLPLRMGTANYCEFRGALMKSYIYFHGRAGLTFRKPGSARLYIGNHPRVAMLRDLDIGDTPVFTLFVPSSAGDLDDYVEAWFLSFERPPEHRPEGLESVVGLGLGQEWLPPPSASYRAPGVLRVGEHRAGEGRPGWPC